MRESEIVERIVGNAHAQTLPRLEGVIRYLIREGCDVSRDVETVWGSGSYTLVANPVPVLSLCDVEWVVEAALESGDAMVIQVVSACMYHNIRHSWIPQRVLDWCMARITVDAVYAALLAFLSWDLETSLRAGVFASCMQNLNTRTYHIACLCDPKSYLSPQVVTGILHEVERFKLHPVDYTVGITKRLELLSHASGIADWLWDTCVVNALDPHERNAAVRALATMNARLPDRIPLLPPALVNYTLWEFIERDTTTEHIWRILKECPDESVVAAVGSRLRADPDYIRHCLDDPQMPCLALLRDGLKEWKGVSHSVSCARPQLVELRVDLYSPKRDTFTVQITDLSSIAQLKTLVATRQGLLCDFRVVARGKEFHDGDLVKDLGGVVQLLVRTGGVCLH